MSAEEIQNLISVAREVGLPFLGGVFILVLVYMLARSFFKKVDSETDMGKEAHSELIGLKEHERGIVEGRLELERKYTECREELAKAEGYIVLLESQNQNAVDEFLDDTHNFDRALDAKDKQILKLTGEVADKDTIILAKDAVIAEQNQTIAKLVADKKLTETKPPKE